MSSKILTTSWQFLVGSCSALCLSLIFGLAGCSEMATIVTPDTTSIPTPTAGNQMPSTGAFYMCPPFNPANTTCTAQYEPVCVKSLVSSVVSLRTASNACSACATPEAEGYVKGECI
ncbi:hypothetical protein [Psychrobacter sp. M13]|uniref:hypothetical protein n=1 Tax=Psychrobacter sp. M13 TaxID=3067275 RepID=UPI00273BBC06|nr:hypothetical protein [Psychrobacter sp. M13]WLP93629.1 hypothetical protein Q9G97_08480 [Psychrobacter sp. M13]